MDKVIQDYLANINNLSQLKPQNLPNEVLKSFLKMDEVEFFKTCSQFYILQNNIPSENSLVNIGESDILEGASGYAKDILKILKKRYEK